jgi:hypothetical protein
VKTSTLRSATNIKSATEGIATRTHAGIAALKELLEPSAIAVNLIEVEALTAR